MENIKWKDWVSYTIDKTTLIKFSYEKIVAILLYELCFFGFSQEEIDREIKIIKNNIKQLNNSLKFKKDL